MSRRHRNVNILEYTMYSHGRGMRLFRLSISRFINDLPLRQEPSQENWRVDDMMCDRHQRGLSYNPLLENATLPKSVDVY